MQLSAVIFDLDDTLYSERAFVQSGMNAVATSMADRFELNSEQVLEDFARLQIEEQGRVFDAWIELRDVAIEASHLISIYRSHKPEIRPFDDAAEVLDALQARGLRLGLVSDGFLETQKNKFEALGLRDYFENEAVVFSDAWGRKHWKPSSKPYQESLRALAVEGSQALYVGDNPSKDFKGARSVGMKSIRMNTIGGVYSKTDPPGADFEPDAEVSRLNEILEVIELWER